MHTKNRSFARSSRWYCPMMWNAFFCFLFILFLAFWCPFDENHCQMDPKDCFKCTPKIGLLRVLHAPPCQMDTKSLPHSRSSETPKRSDDQCLSSPKNFVILEFLYLWIPHSPVSELYQFSDLRIVQSLNMAVSYLPFPNSPTSDFRTLWSLIFFPFIGFSDLPFRWSDLQILWSPIFQILFDSL